MRPLPRLLAAAPLLVALWANVPAAAQQAAPRERTVFIAQAGQVNTLDPLRSDYAQTNLIDATLYDTLVTYDYDSKLVGRLATSFSLAPDVLSVAITLRPDAKFHDGTPVTAADVAYTLDRLKKLGVGIAAQIDGYQSTTIADPTHLTIHLSKPYSLFLGALSKIYILNAGLLRKNAGADDGQAWLQAHEAGGGPFKLAGQEGQDVTVDTFDGTWDKQPRRPDAFVFRRIDESATQRDELRAGNVDLALIGMGYRDAAALDKEDGTKDAKLRVAIQAQVVFNTRVGPTADPRVRKAIRLAYDYAGGLENVRLGGGGFSTGPLPTTMECRPNLPAARRDVAGAKKLLAEAGVSDLHLTMKFQPILEAQRLEATLLQSNLKDIGVTLSLEPIAFPAYMASLRNVESIPQMMYMEDFAQFPDPGTMLLKGFRSDAIGTNRGAYANPEVDKLLDTAAASADEATRCEAYKKVQEILDAQSVFMPIYTVTKPAVYRTSMLKPFSAHPSVYPINPIDLRLATSQ